MKREIPEHHFAIDPPDDWVVEDDAPEQRAALGIYVRSSAFGLYVNVREQSIDPHPKTRDGLLAFLREQNWASPPEGEWTETTTTTVAVGGTFEMTPDRSGEVVHEVFVTDGRIVVNLASPGDRAVVQAALSSVRRLVSSLVLG